MPRVLIADDHPLFRNAIKDVIGRLFLSQGWDFAWLEATRCSEVAAVVEREEELDLILLDLSMPDAHGLSTLVALRSKAPATPVVVISSLDDPATVRQAMACGAAGFIPKSSPKDLIATALQVVFAGGVYMPRALLDDVERRTDAAGAPGDDAGGDALTPRQSAVLDLLVRGMSNKHIARNLAISDATEGARDGGPAQAGRQQPRPGHRGRPEPGRVLEGGKPMTPRQAVRRGCSQARDPAAAQEMHDALHQPGIGFAVFFCSPAYDLDALGAEIHRRFGATGIIGCTTAGEIGPAGYLEGTITGSASPRRAARRRPS